MSDGELRVLHVDTGREFRGGQRQARLLVRRLAGRPDVRQEVVTRGGSRVAREMEAAGAAVRPVPWGPALDPRAVAAVARALPGADVAHAHSSHALQALILARAGTGAPTGLVAARRVGTAPAAPAVWRRADLVLAVSGASRDVLVRAGVEPRRVRVVHSGVDTDELRRERPGVLREAAGAGDGDVLVGAVGALTQEKGHRTLLRAGARVASERREVRFVIAGDGPLRGDLEALAAELGIGDRVALPGHVPEVARSLADLDVYVMPSRDEGFPIATAEAMWLGIPTVVTEAGGLPELVGDAAPLVPTDDPEALATAILRLVRDEGLRRRLGEAVSDRARAFTAAATARGTLSAYRAVVGSAWERRAHLRRARGRPVPPPPERLRAGAPDRTPVPEAAGA